MTAVVCSACGSASRSRTTCCCPIRSEFARLDMRVRYRGHSLDTRLTKESLTIRGRGGAAAPIALFVDGQSCEFTSGSTRVFALKNGTAPAAGGVIERPLP